MRSAQTAQPGAGSLSSMEAISADVWPSILEMLSNSAFCSLSACSKACRQVSSYKRTLKLELDGEQQLHSRLVSLLCFLTNRRNGLQVCCVQHDLMWPGVLGLCCSLRRTLLRAGEWQCQAALLLWQNNAVWFAGYLLGDQCSLPAAGQTLPLQGDCHGYPCKHCGGMQRAPGMIRPARELVLL